MKNWLKKTWNWLLGKTTIDEKVVEVVNETKQRISDVKREAKDVVAAAKGKPTQKRKPTPKRGSGAKSSGSGAGAGKPTQKRKPTPKRGAGAKSSGSGAGKGKYTPKRGSGAKSSGSGKGAGRKK
jgi:hypothetical protein